MKYVKIFGLIAIGFLPYLSALSQSNQPIIYESTASGTQRSLRQGSYSNRTTNGVNNNIDPRTWTYHPMISGWNSRFYGGKTLAGSSTTGGSISSGSTTLTTSASFFASSDAGKTVEIIGAGPAGGLLTATISTYTSSTQVTISTPASTTVTKVILHVGDATKPAYTEGHYTTYSNGNFEMNYRLLFPANYSQVENYKYPLIVFLHGAGERANCWNGSCFYNSGITSITNGASISAGTNTLTRTSGTFSASDVNKDIQIPGAGSSGGTYFGTITTYTNATHVTLNNNAATSVTNKTFTYGYGTDNQYRNNDLNLTHGGQVHLEAIYNASTGSNGKKAEDPTLPTRGWPGFVFIPQNQDGWSGSGQYDQVVKSIDLLVAYYNIDPDRIYIHGLSNGGSAAWEVLNTRPDLFAGILPMSATISYGSSPVFNANIASTVTIPSWIFQGGTDTTPLSSLPETNQLVARLKAFGGTPRYYIYPTTGHGTWGAAYNEPDFFSWMLKKNKTDIQILFGDSTLCATDNSGVKLALGTGFLAYQWEQDGAIMGSGFTTSTITVTQPGTYRARFSRISATPSEAQWNKWSKPVIIRQTPAITPTITAIGTSHLPDVNNGNIIRINGPTTKDLTKNWLVDGVVNTTNTNFPTLNNKDTSNYTLRTTAGRVSLKTIPLNTCSSLESNSIYVTMATPVSLIAPVNPQLVVLNSGSIQLFWTDNTPDEMGFEIFRSSTGLAGSYNFFKLLNQGATSFTDTGLTPGTTYYYQIRAVNNTSVSTYAPISGTTTIDTQPPTAPQNLIFTNRTLSSITLSWTASTDNTGISGYNIYYGSTTVPTNSTATTFTLTGLSGNSNYLITVKAIDLAANLSAASNQLTASTTFSGLNYTYSAVNVNSLTDAGNNWTTPERTGTVANFDISLRLQDDFFNFNFSGYIYITLGGTYQFRTTSDDGSMLFLQGPFLNPNPDFTTYRIVNNDGLHGNTPVTSGNISLPSNTAQQITAIFFEQTGGQSLTVEYIGPDTNGWVTIPNSVLNSGSAPNLTPPTAPTNVVATQGGMTSINLTWTAASGANSYEIYRSVGSSNTYSIIGTVATTPFTDTGLLPSTTYNYKLKSISNTNGSSSLTATATPATTAPDTQAPTPPSNVLLLSSNYTNAGIKWDSSTDNVGVAGYKIYNNGTTLLGSSTSNTFYTTNLLPGTFYNLTVSAYDIAGNESAQSSSLASFATNAPLTFYSKAASVDLTQLTSWTDNVGGTGTIPTSFNYDGQYFVIQNSQTLNSTLGIGGAVSRIFVNDGVSLTLNQSITGILKLNGSASLNVNYDFQPTFETISPTSTVNYNTYSSIPIATYGNLVLNGSGLKNVTSGTLEVQGDLTLTNGVGINGGSSNSTTVKIGSHLITGSSVATVSADNRVNLLFANNSSHNLTANSNLSFYKITTGSTDVITLNTSSAQTLSLGSPNGGGLDLASGSSLVIGNNTLTLTDKAAVNPTNTTGKLSINNGNIQITTTATTNANFYFDATNNKVTNFTMQETGIGIIQIRSMMEIYNGLKINSGTLAANGNVTIKSTVTASASIQQIAGGGSITGNVIVERYVDPKRVYRYISTPVASLTVANWQNNFPITGSFSGASTGTGLSSNSSMFDYNETRGIGTAGYLAYPVSANTEPIQVGKGYAAYIREGTNPITWTNTGVPNQGNINLSLTGTNSPSSTTGWNLLGNPYPSDIIWSNNGWTSSGVSNVVYVRENLVGGGIQWRTWDRQSNSGTLTNGQIPAGQAFWVQTSTTNPSLQVTEAAKTAQPASSNTNFYRTGNDAPNYLFSISINNGTYQDYAYVKLTDGGTDNYDKIRDGFKNRNSFFNLSTLSADGVDLAVNDLENSFCDKIIPINLATINSGTYILQFENLDNFSLANVKLVDSYTNTTTNITSSNPQYTITVTTDAASYQNRLSLQLTRPSIISNNIVATQKDIFCRSEESVMVEVRNSQSGVAYEALSTSNSILSSQVMGNGETIYLMVPVKDLAANQNTLRVRSSFPGCSSTLLVNTKTISISELPTVTTQSSVSACLGSPFDLTASGTGTKYQWENASSGQVLRETGGTLRISVINPINAYQVTAINASGCKGAPTIILVRADSLDLPTISMTEGILKTNAIQSLQWLLDGTPIAGANMIELQPTLSGSYSVQAKNTYCARVSAPYLVTAIEDSGNRPFILTVFPNPSESGHFTVSGNSSSLESLQVNVIDMIGRDLATLPLSIEDYTKGVQLQQKISSGIYIVKVKQGDKVVYQKLIVK